MRLPVTPQISTKDATSNKNSRLTNCLKESKPSGDKAVVRPGLVTSDTFTGIGSGLIPFDGRLLVIYDDTVTDVEASTWPWPLDAPTWSVTDTYCYGDSVFYLGNMYFSLLDACSNTGNTPSTSPTYWAYSAPIIPTWDSSATYTIGDSVSVGRTTYYSLMTSNTNKNPLSADPQQSGVWSTTQPATTGTQYSMSVAGPWHVDRNSAMLTGMAATEGDVCALGKTKHNHGQFLDGSNLANWLQDCTDGLGNYSYQDVPFGPAAFFTRVV
jgi:hypothetical protein